MAVQRDNDDERAAIVQRLLEESRPLDRREQGQRSTRKPNGSDRGQQVERRRHRSDAELRKQRAELERLWNEEHERGQTETVIVRTVPAVIEWDHV